MRMDDDEYLRQSAHWQGLSWGAVRWAFTSTAPYYQPLPRLSHVLDYQLWGTNAREYYVTSIVLHALNAALVFGFLWTLLGRAGVSLTARERLALAIGVAVAFAIHPLQFESVAWMSGRTQLLCTTFGVGSLWAYVAGARRWVVWALFVVALVLQTAGGIDLPFCDAGVGLLATPEIELGTAISLERSVPCRGFAGSGGDHHYRIACGRSACAIRGNTAIATLAPDDAEPDVLRLETGCLADSAIALLSKAGGYPAGPAICPCVGTWRGGHLRRCLCGVRDAHRCYWRGGGHMCSSFCRSGLALTGGEAVADRYAYLAMLPLLVLAGGAMVWVWRRCPMIARCGLACGAPDGRTLLLRVANAGADFGLAER